MRRSSYILPFLAVVAPFALIAADFQTQSKEGMKITLSIADPVDMDVTTFKICSDKDVAVSQAKLWMTAHGHGSSPTKIQYDAASKCSIVKKVNFSMPGRWDVKLTFANGDSAVFSDISVKVGQDESL